MCLSYTPNPVCQLAYQNIQEDDELTQDNEFFHYDRVRCGHFGLATQDWSTFVL